MKENNSKSQKSFENRKQISTSHGTDHKKSYKTGYKPTTGLAMKSSSRSGSRCSGSDRLSASALPMRGKGCPSMKFCGGCSLQGIAYEKQLELKQRKVQSLLSPYGKAESIIGMENPKFYRNKVHHVCFQAKNGFSSGIYKAGTHHVIPVEECMIEDERSQLIIHTIEELARSFKLQPYDEDLRRGFLRHILVRRGFKTGEIMVVLVTATDRFPSKHHFVEALLELHPEITTIVMNVNDRKTTFILGKKNETLYGNGYIKDKLLGLTFRISPGSFYQVNPVQTEKLYAKAIEFADLKGNETVLDAYCGIGTIGLCAAQKAGKVLGVELNVGAIADAKLNAKENKVENVDFVAQDAGKYMLERTEENEKIDVVFMDPPRTGSTPEFIEAVMKCGPKRIVYVSCDPVTLARDLGMLTDPKAVGSHYQVKKIAPVDMFPFTEHVETVVLLGREFANAKDHAYIDYEPHNIEFPGSATYPEIKEWISEHYNGMKVSSLYISQIKRKCGLEVGESYNKPKTPDSRQPQCPADKAEVIEIALRHFKMI